MRRFAAILALAILASLAMAEPSAEDLSLVQKYKTASFSPGNAKPSKDYGTMKFYQLTDSTKIWAYWNGFTVVETPEKLSIRIYSDGGEEYGREMTLPSGRVCQVAPDGRIEWGVVMEKAPDFALARLGGDASSVRLSDARGKVLLLDFWASWCGPCMAALPKTQALYEKYKDRGLLVYGINIEGDAEKAAEVEKRLKLSFPTLMAEAGEGGGFDWKSRQVADFRVTAIPAVFLVDKTGLIVAMNPDERTIEGLLSR